MKQMLFFAFLVGIAFTQWFKGIVDGEDQVCPAPFKITNPGPQFNLTFDKFLSTFRTSITISKQLPLNKQTNKYSLRKKIYEDNLLRINRHNMDPHRTFDMGINEFAYLDIEEFAGLYLSTYDSQKKPQIYPLEQRHSPQPFIQNSQPNSRTSPKSSPSPQFNNPKRLLTPFSSISIDYSCYGQYDISHQGKCGACYAFATTGTVAIIQKIYTNNYYGYSAQHLVSYMNEGCKGSSLVSTYSFMRSKGLYYSQELKYKNAYSKIKKHFSLSSSFKPKRIVSRYKRITNCLDLLAALEKKPVAVGVYFGARMMSYYRGQINLTNTFPNHAVILVGVTHRGLKVKNSWGIGWGQQGYLYINKSQIGNICKYAVNVETTHEKTSKVAGACPVC